MAQGHQHQDQAFTSLWAVVNALSSQWRNRPASPSPSPEDQMPEKTNGHAVNETNETNETTLDSFDWLDEAFIAEVTGESEDDIGDVRMANAVAEGSNYCSTLLRVQANAAGRPISLIVKTMPKGEMMQHFVTELGFFRKEISMLADTLPKLQRLGAARCGPDSPLAQLLGPECLPYDRPDTVVMYDLSALGYRNADRRAQLDLRHCQVALSILARLHALSVAQHREDPASVEKYHESIYLAKNSETSTKHVNNQLRNFGDEVDTWEELKDFGYGDKLRAISETAFSRLCEQTERKDGVLNVLNHGDFWINNFMFRYESEEDTDPVDIRLVDLQMSRFSAPTLDLQYFVNTSVKEEVREKELDILLEHYRRELNANLCQLGLEDVTLSAEELRRDFEAKSFFGLYAAIGIMCVVVAEPSERARLDDLSMDDMPTTDPMLSAWRGKNFKRLIPKLLEHYTKTGIL